MLLWGGGAEDIFRCENHMNPINKLHGKNAEMDVKASGTYSYHSDL